MSSSHGKFSSPTNSFLEPKGTPVERNRISSSDYRKKNPERAKTSARLSNFRARARKKGLTNDKDIEDKVNQWEKEWQEKQAKEASEVCSRSSSLVIPFPSFTLLCLPPASIAPASVPVCTTYSDNIHLQQYFSGILLSAFE